MIALSLGNAYNFGDEAGVEEERLPSGDGVSADERVLGRDGITADRAAKIPRALSLQIGGVDRSEAFKVFLHRGGQLVISGILRGPEGVAAAASRWTSKDFEGSV